jgi:hypothetical protein
MAYQSHEPFWRDASGLFGVLAPQAQQAGLRELADHDLLTCVLYLLPL